MSLGKILRATTAAAALTLAADTLQAQQGCTQKVDSTWYDKAKARMSNVFAPARVDTVYIGCPITRKPAAKPAPKPAPRRIQPTQPVPVNKESYPDYTMQITVDGITDTTLIVNQHDRPLIPVHFGDRIYITGKGTRLTNCKVSGRDASTNEFLRAYTPADTAITFGVDTRFETYDAHLRIDCDDTTPEGVVRDRTPRDRRAFFYPKVRTVDTTTVVDTTKKRVEDDTPRTPSTPTVVKAPKEPMKIPSRFIHAYAGLGNIWQSQEVTNMSGGVSREKLNAPLRTAGVSYLDKVVSLNAKVNSYEYSGVETSASHMTTDIHTSAREIDAAASVGYILTLAGEFNQRKLHTTERFTLAIPGQPVVNAAEDNNATTTQAGAGIGMNVPWRFGRVAFAGMVARQTDNSGRQGTDAANGYSARGMLSGVIGTPWLKGKALPFEVNTRYTNYEGGVVPGTSSEYANSTFDLNLSYSLFPSVRLAAGMQHQTIHDAEFKTAKVYTLTGRIGF